PCLSVKAPGSEQRRDVVLNGDQLAALWRALGDEASPVSMPIRNALKFMLVTGQRKGEVAAAAWDEFADGVWTIPSSRAKNGLRHRVPLSPLALTVLDDMRGVDRRWVFPSPHSAQPANDALDRAMRDNRERFGAGDATPHDLRRSAASGMAGLGINR